MAAEASSRSLSPDSYIGSFISLTSKSEIRYEGILYIINTDESSIGLRNVRSFGTEGRKKDGQQVPASDKIYEFILFRGSDIKDLQVKASPPAQITPMKSDPSIIQSNSSPPPTASPSLPANLPSFGSFSAPELISNTAQFGLQHPSLSTYQTGGSFGTWNATPLPPLANVSRLAAPMYWPGYYAHSQGHSHLQQTSLMRPPTGLAMSPMQQTLQFQDTNALLSSGPSSFPDFPPLFPPVSSGLNLAYTSLPSTVTPTQVTSLTSGMPPFSVSNKVSNTSPAPIPSVILPPVSSLASSMETSASLSQKVPSVVNSKTKTGPFSSVASQSETRSTLPTVGSAGSKKLETSVNLVTDDQLIRLTPSMRPSSQSLETVPNELEVKPPEDRTKALLSEQSAPESEAKTKPTSVHKEPILPLPLPAYQKASGAILHATQTRRGDGRGRGAGYARPVAKFSEDFDFTAMNEKFDKDKVWGNLGKSKAYSINREEEDAGQSNENNAESLKVNAEPVYVKDDFFDTLSCNTNDQTSSGRIKYSEQLKIDAETFGNFQWNHSAHVGRGLRGGGGRGRSSYPGRSYGYSARGRGYSGNNGAS